MSEENNVYGNNNNQPEYNGQSGYGGQPEYNSQPQAGQQNAYNTPQGYQQNAYGGSQDYGQQPGDGSQDYNQPYGGQNQQTPLSGYAEPVYHKPEPNAEVSQGFGIASMVCGILALVTCCFWCLSLPLAAVSIVMGIVQISKGSAGRGMAIAGIICSAIGALLAIFLIVAGALMNTNEFNNSYWREYNRIMEELQDDYDL